MKVADRIHGIPLGTNLSCKHMTALVVENIDNLRLALVSMLIETGFGKVLHATNGNDALEVLAANKVDLIIAESQMPKMEGITLLQKVRFDPKTALIPFIMISATIDEAQVMLALKSGVSEYVVKPFTIKIMIERIKRAISRPIKYKPRLLPAIETIEVVKTDTSAQPERAKLQVLVVDDVVGNIQLLMELLKDDYTIKAATNGELALKLCASDNPPDLVLLDIMMPDMDGLEVCRQLKNNPQTQHITVIFITTMDQTHDVVKGLALGAVDYITKPIIPDIIKARVNTHSKLIEANNAARAQVDAYMELHRLKEEFDRVVQNDLRHPIEEILQSLDLLNRHGRIPAKVKLLENTLRGSTYKLSHMIENMLALFMIEDGSYQLHPITLNLNDIVTEMLDLYQNTASQKGLEIDFKPEQEHLISGELLLTQSVLCNLYRNAIEAAPRGSVVAIELAREGRFQKITLKNHGMIPLEIHSNFFEKYVCAGKSSGTGIGTYAAKLMTEVQGGKISFRTSELEGTTLFVSLPAE